jgi:hypothetical protein
LIQISSELVANSFNFSFQTILDTLYRKSPSDKLYGSDECETRALTKRFLNSLLVDVSFSSISFNFCRFLIIATNERIQFNPDLNGYLVHYVYTVYQGSFETCLLNYYFILTELHQGVIIGMTKFLASVTPVVGWLDYLLDPNT